MVNASKVNAKLEEHIQEQQEKNAEFKLLIDVLNKQMTTMVRQQAIMQNSIN